MSSYLNIRLGTMHAALRDIVNSSHLDRICLLRLDDDIDVSMEHDCLNIRRIDSLSAVLGAVDINFSSTSFTASDISLFMSSDPS